MDAPLTEPLIDPEELIAAYWSGTHEDAAQNMMDYLRSVLTPEALDTHGTRTRDSSGRWVYRARMPRSGTDLYRRIFGEDK